MCVEVQVIVIRTMSFVPWTHFPIILCKALWGFLNFLLLPHLIVVSTISPFPFPSRPQLLPSSTPSVPPPPPPLSSHSFPMCRRRLWTFPCRRVIACSTPRTTRGSSPPPCRPSSTARSSTATATSRLYLPTWSLPGPTLVSCVHRGHTCTVWLSCVHRGHTCTVWLSCVHRGHTCTVYGYAPVYVRSAE